MNGVWAPGAVVAERYRIVRGLGTGGSATTYEAESIADGTRVALKHIAVRSLHEWKTLDLFEREAQTLANLAHPSIPRYVDHFKIEDADGLSFFLVQTLAPGRSLADWRRSGWLPGEPELKALAEQVLEILRYLHTLNPPVIHRDLKPQNLIRDERGTIALVDFGAVRNTPSSTLTAGSTVVGTYGYMAPEQLHGSARPASDLYGLGTTLLFLMTGRPPTELPHKELRIDFRRHVQASRAFAAWLERMVEPIPERRFPSAHLALSALRSGQTTGARSGSNKRVFVLAGIMVALAAAAVPAVLSLRTDARAAAADKAAKLRATANGLPVRPSFPAYPIAHHAFAIGAHVSAVFGIDFTRDGSGILTSSNDRTIKLWSAKDGKPVRAFPGHTGRVGDVKASPDGVHVVSSGDTTLKVWDLKTGALVRDIPLTGPAQATGLALSPDGSLAVVGRFSGTAEVWNVTTGTLVRTVEHSKGRRVLTVAMSPDGRTFATGGDSADILLWDLATGASRGALKGHTKAVGDLAFAPDGQTLASASDDRTAIVWHAGVQKRMATLSTHTDEVWTVAFSPDGATLATASKDGTIGFWNPVNGSFIQRVTPGQSEPMALAFSPDGTTLANGQSDGTVRVWRMTSAMHTEVPKVDLAKLGDSASFSPVVEAKLTFNAHRLFDRWSGGGELEEAKALLGEALAKNPRYAPAVAGLARYEFKRAYVRGREYEPAGLARAEAHVARALALDPKCADAYAVRAWVLSAKKDLAGAKEAADAADRLDPGSPTVGPAVVEVAIQRGTLDVAEARLKTIITTTNDRTLVGRAYGQLQEIYQAREDVNALDESHRIRIALAPESAWAKGNYAGFLFNIGKHDQAIEVAQAALAQMDYGAAHHTLAEALTGDGVARMWDHSDFERAKPLFVRAIEHDPRYAEAHYALGAYWLAKGDTAQAKKELERTVALDPKHERARAALVGL